MASVRCSGCKCYKCLEEFGIKNNGEQQKTCTKCRERNKQYRIKLKANIKKDNIIKDKVNEIIIKQNKQVKQDKIVNDKTNNYNHAAAAVLFNPDIKNIINDYLIGDNNSFKNKFNHSLYVINAMQNLKEKGTSIRDFFKCGLDRVEVIKATEKSGKYKRGTRKEKYWSDVADDLMKLSTNFTNLIDNLE